jgi:Mg2+ and Co2+ transporter CorA
VSDATDEALLNLERQYGVSAKHIKRGLEDHDPSSGYRHAQYLILHYDEVSRDTSRFTKQGASVTSSRCVLICKDGLLISVSKNVPASVARVWSELQSPDIEIQPPATSNALATRIIGSHLYGCEKTVSELSRDTDEYVERYSSKLPNAKDLKWTRSMTRNLSTCKQSVEALNPVIDRLQERRNFFGEPNAVEALERYQGITRSIKERIETTRQEVRNLDESWDSIYRNWQTKLVTYLALIGTGIAPVSLAAAIFGVNFRQMPSDTTMWLALGASALVSVGMIGAMLFSKKAAGR